MRKKKIKILHVAQAAGGVDRYIRMLLKYLDEQQGRAEAKQRNITDKKLSRQSAHQKQLQSLQK